MKIAASLVPALACFLLLSSSSFLVEATDGVETPAPSLAPSESPSLSPVPMGSQFPLPNCDKESYYANLTAEVGPVDSWTKEDVMTLIIDTHRIVLPNTSPKKGEDDILLALIDLYPGNRTNDTVQLLYRDISFPAYPAGNPYTWEREDLWPKIRGAVATSPALTDVHSKRPADSTVRIAKEALFFGVCGVVESELECSRPATTETAEDTEQDDKVFAPPVRFRGGVARSLFYTALRYEVELGLVLTDCPPFSEGEFGYLSMLLEWHSLYDVTTDEEEVNDRACSRWQGNRNPFVDYPQLVEKFFGQPDTVAEGGYMYTGCAETTDMPTATPNQCSLLLAPGDLPIFVMNSDDPDLAIFYALADIPATIGELYVTDNAWTGTELQDTEGTLRFTIPEGGVKTGQSFGFGPGAPLEDQWDQVDPEKTFELDSEGDQFFVYCMDADDLPRFLYGFSYNGDWAEPGLDDYGTGTSALPEQLEGDGNVAVPHEDNCLYIGPQAGPKSELQEAFSNPSFYNCIDDQRYVPNTAQPTASPSTAQPTASPSTAQPTASPNTAQPTASPNTAQPTASPNTADQSAASISKRSRTSVGTTSLMLVSVLISTLP